MGHEKGTYRFLVNGRRVVLHGASVREMRIDHGYRNEATVILSFDYMLDETPQPEPTYDFRVEVEGVDGETTSSKARPRPRPRPKRPPESYRVPVEPFDPTAHVDPNAPPRPTPRSSSGPVDDWPEDMNEPEGFKGPTDPQERPFRPRGPEPRGPEPRTPPRSPFGTKGRVHFADVHFDFDRAGAAQTFEEFDRAVREMFSQAAAGSRRPPPAPPPVGGWAKTLENPTTLAAAEANYKRLAKVAHPDHGGSHDAMVALNAAIAVARKHFKR